MQTLIGKIAGTKRAIAFGLVAVLNVVHPFIHGFEGGGFDIILVNLDALLLQFDAMVPWHSYDHCDGHDEAVDYMQQLDDAWRPCPELWDSACGAPT